MDKPSFSDITIVSCGAPTLELNHLKVTGFLIVYTFGLKPDWIFALGLFVSFLVFAYFCVFPMPFIL
jgi:hypothetical protein